MFSIHSRNRKIRPGGGFSVPELLVALIIVAVLVALAGHGFQAATQKAGTLQCVANLRTLYSAISLYANDHRQAFPHTSEKAAVDWHRKVWPYLAPTGTYDNWTDAFHEAATHRKPWPYFCPTLEVRLLSYAVNENLKDNKLQYIPEVLMLLDSRGSDKDPAPVKAVTGSAANLSAGRIGARHQGKANLLFQDGHVEARFLHEIRNKTDAPRFWGP